MKQIYTLAIALFTSLSGFAQIPTNGLVAEYNFNTTTTSWEDDGTNNYDLCNTSSVSLTAGMSTGDSAVAFGGNQRLYFCDGTTGGTSEFVSTGIASTSVWFYANQTNGYRALATIRGAGNGGANAFCLYISSGALAGYVNSSGASIQGTTAISTGAWHHAVFTHEYDNGTGALKLYLDGVLEATQAFSSHIDFTNDLFVIGAAGNGGDYFNGVISQVLYYNRTLTSTEVTNIYNANPPCVVNIPDANFKNYLLNQTAINTNDNSEIECTEASAYTGQIIKQSGGISNLTGIEAFVNITGLDVSLNNISSVDLSKNIALTNIRLVGNPITSLNLSNNTALTSLDLANCTQLTALDLSHNGSLTAFSAGNNIQLASLNLANNNNTNMTYVYLANDNALTCIQVDNAAYCTTNWTNPNNFVKPAGAIYSENCTPVSGIAENSVNTIGVYPNPVKETLYLELKKEAAVQIYSATGMLMGTWQPAQNLPINVSSLPNGLYFIRSENGTGTSFIKE